MREAFISILALLAIVSPPSKCSDVGKDGFNFYKDYLRGRSDDVMVEGPVSNERMLSWGYSRRVEGKVFCRLGNPRMTLGVASVIGYDFYRTPLQLYPGLLPAIEQEYRKRTGNAFKNHMLSKELFADEERPGKRGSKTALSLMMNKHHPYYADEGHNCPFGK